MQPRNRGFHFGNGIWLGFSGILTLKEIVTVLKEAVLRIYQRKRRRSGG